MSCSDSEDFNKLDSAGRAAFIAFHKQDLRLCSMAAAVGPGIEEAFKDYVKEVDELRLSRPDVNFQNPLHLMMTPLHMAIETQRLDIVKWILTKPNLDLDVRDKAGMTPYVKAISCLRPGNDVSINIVGAFEAKFDEESLASSVRYFYKESNRHSPWKTSSTGRPVAYVTLEHAANSLNATFKGEALIVIDQEDMELVLKMLDTAATRTWRTKLEDKKGKHTKAERDALLQEGRDIFSKAAETLQSGVRTMFDGIVVRPPVHEEAVEDEPEEMEVETHAGHESDSDSDDD